MTIMVVEEATNDSSRDGESYGQRQRKLRIVMSGAEEASYISVDGGGSYGPIPR